MTDQEFICAFEDASIDAAGFDHRAHLRAAYLYLSRYPFLEACIAMRNGLQRFAHSIGKVGLYHETITIAFMSIVRERMGERPELDWQGLLAANPELCERDLLARYFTPATLASPAARQFLVLSGLDHRLAGAPAHAP